MRHNGKHYCDCFRRFAWEFFWKYDKIHTVFKPLLISLSSPYSSWVLNSVPAHWVKKANDLWGPGVTWCFVTFPRCQIKCITFRLKDNKKKQHLDRNLGLYDIVHRCLISYLQHWLIAALKILPDVDGLIWGSERDFCVIRDYVFWIFVTNKNTELKSVNCECFTP